MRHVALILVAVSLGCTGSSDRATPDGPKPGAAAPAPAPVEPIVDETAEPPPPDVLAPHPGPLPANAGDEARQSAVFELLAGGAKAADLPDEVTDIGHVWDPGIEFRLSQPFANPSPSKVALGKPTASEGLSPEIIRRVVRKNRASLASCYDASPSLGSPLEVVMTWTIKDNGKVSERAISSKDGLDPEFERCSRDAIARWIFPNPKGSKPVTVEEPATFTRQTRGRAR